MVIRFCNFVWIKIHVVLQCNGSLTVLFSYTLKYYSHLISCYIKHILAKLRHPLASHQYTLGFHSIYEHPFNLGTSPHMLHLFLRIMLDNDSYTPITHIYKTPGCNKWGYGHQDKVWGLCLTSEKWLSLRQIAQHIAHFSNSVHELVNI